MFYETAQLTLSTNHNMSADFSSAFFECGAWDCGGIIATWTGADGTSALVIPQFSLEDPKSDNWCNYVSEANAQKVDGPAGCKMYNIEKVCFPYVRLAFLAKTNTTGALMVKIWMKRQFGVNR